ncbi:acyltransferase family protein [Desulforhopalus singaporensis]|uniref:Fucose 4-O-acetylase n=1 Tax=Desulforhopalus singaporensis TaxID=91360 RepID=A0A1H0TAJ3_9BACT|nr:acyltransferase family protein [Desulforhopalus singaporensis]SDP50811.1 Fucose 4-O-acetylase [Desulforhopalus singaporensis]
MNNRDLWVDYSKAIGIVLVVYGHVAHGICKAGLPVDMKSYLLIDSVIYAFHIPLFFFLSGLYFFRSLEKYGSVGLLVNKIDAIIYPYLVWSILQGSVEVVFSKLTHHPVTFSDVFSSMLWGTKTHLWFLYALFFIFFLAILLYRKRSKPYCFIVLSIACVVFVHQDYLPKTIFLKYIFSYFVFFALGVFCKEFRNIIEAHLYRWTILSFVFFLSYQYIYHNILHLTYTDIGIPLLVLSVISILFIISFSSLICRKPSKIILLIGSNSMTIYLMHVLSYSGARIVLCNLFKIRNFSVHVVVGTLAGVIAPLVAVYLFRLLRINFLYIMPRLLSAEVFYKKISHAKLP